MKIGAAVITEPDCEMLHSIVEDFLQIVDQTGSITDIVEVTFNIFSFMLRTSDRRDFIANYSNTLSLLELDDLGRTDWYDEKLIDDNTDSQKLLEKTHDCFCGEPLRQEIERIEQGGSLSRHIYHPVHYIVQTDSKKNGDLAVEILLSFLHKNKRIRSRRYVEIEVDKIPRYNISSCDGLFKAGKNTAIVIYCEKDCEPERGELTRNTERIKTLCEMINSYYNDVLIIFKLNISCENTKNIIYDVNRDMSFVEIKENALSGIIASEFLVRLAAQRGLEPDKKLMEISRKKGKTYSAADITSFFNTWLSNKMKTEIFPQYRHFMSATREIIEEKPKGTAYDELADMIGLDRVKLVIDKAINYYKAQKLFAAKGLGRHNIAMNMVFTGNPGTAKTTVARLFAQILKDNDILPVGDLYELGRADLVGRYVGWTAQIVKEKFKQTKGSVLFIDEAYSLLDGSHSSFGVEAINTIVQEMENSRNDTIVIFAGYPDEMEQFLNQNPGLSSRIAYKIHFDDYTPEQLCSITELMARQSGMCLAADVRSKILPMFKRAAAIPGFGNGRYARNLFEKARLEQSNRLIKMDIDKLTSEEMRLIKAEDFSQDGTLILKPERKAIGFNA